jgi:hypothetical protein
MYRFLLLFLFSCAEAQDPSYVDASVDSTTRGSGGIHEPTQPTTRPRSSSGVKRDASTLDVMSRCECFLYPRHDPPYFCLEEVCVGSCDNPGPTGFSFCVYTNSDPAPI